MKLPTVVEKEKVKIEADEVVMLHSALVEFSSSMYLDGNNELAKKYAALAEKIKVAGKI